MEETLRIKVENFGMKDVVLYEIEGISEIFILTFEDHDKQYYTVCDENLRMLVPISTDVFRNVYANRYYHDYAITFLNQESGKTSSYHLTRKDDGLLYLATIIQSDDAVNRCFVGTEKDNYWFIESTAYDMKQFSLYDVSEHKILTPAFSEISFEQRKGPVFAFVRKELVVRDQDQNIYLDNLMAFIDQNGNFITDLYSSETDMLIDIRKYNLDKTFNSFVRFIDSLAEDRMQEYLEKNNHIDDVLTDLFNHPYTPSELKILERKAKVIPFRQEVK